MKAFRILGRNIRDSFKSVFRNFSLSLASIMCITITLIVVSIASILSYNVNNFSRLVEKEVTIVVFLDSDITEQEKNAVENAIVSMPDVEDWTYQSKEDIKKEWMESSETYESIMESWTEEDNPLQPTFQIKVSDIDTIESVADDIKKLDKVDVVKYGEGYIEQIIYIFDIINNVSIGIVFALIIVTAFLITNTIKITIYSRKREIEIMRLVGASNINIKIPFVLEGLLLGVMGSIIPIGVTIYGYNFLYNTFNGQVISPFIRLVEPLPYTMFLSLILLSIGVIVGMFGSYLAVIKYLKK